MVISMAAIHSSSAAQPQEDLTSSKIRKQGLERYVEELEMSSHARCCGSTGMTGFRGGRRGLPKLKSSLIVRFAGPRDGFTARWHCLLVNLQVDLQLGRRVLPARGCRMDRVIDFRGTDRVLCKDISGPLSVSQIFAL